MQLGGPWAGAASPLLHPACLPCAHASRSAEPAQLRRGLRWKQGPPSPALSSQPGPEASPAGELASFWAWPRAQRGWQVPEGRKQGAESGGRASRACAWGPPTLPGGRPGGIWSSPWPPGVSCGPGPALGRRLRDGGDSLGVAVSRGGGAGLRARASEVRLSPAPVSGAPSHGSVRALAGHGDVRGAPPASVPSGRVSAPPGGPQPRP